jgi:hypothetical protein
MGRYRQHAQGRSGPSAFIYTLLGAVLIGCGVMGLSLKGAKVAYEKLWDQLKAQGEFGRRWLPELPPIGASTLIAPVAPRAAELENSRMEQNVAAMKVEAVTSQAKAEDLETMRAMLQRNVEDTRGRVQEVRTRRVSAAKLHAWQVARLYSTPDSFSARRRLPTSPPPHRLPARACRWSGPTVSSRSKWPRRRPRRNIQRSRQRRTRRSRTT